jgi:hypothetical protein
MRCRDTSHCTSVFTPVVSSVAFINGFEPVATNGRDENGCEFYRVQDRRMELWGRYRLGSIVGKYDVDQDQLIMADGLAMS